MFKHGILDAGSIQRNWAKLVFRELSSPVLNNPTGEAKHSREIICLADGNLFRALDD